jgi:hypothetical protein
MASARHVQELSPRMLLNKLFNLILVELLEKMAFPPSSSGKWSPPLYH